MVSIQKATSLWNIICPSILPLAKQFIHVIRLFSVQKIWDTNQGNKELTTITQALKLLVHFPLKATVATPRTKLVVVGSQLSPQLPGILTGGW